MRFAKALRFVVIGVMSAAPLACTADTARPGPNAARSEQDCPVMIRSTLANQSSSDLAARGAADELPPDGATARDRVDAAVRLNTGGLEARYPGISAISTGPGLGWTYSQDHPLNLTIAYHHVTDFAVFVHLRAQSDCPALNLFVPNDHDQRVPVLFVYPNDGSSSAASSN